MEKFDNSLPPPYEQPPPNRPAPGWQMKLPPGMGPPTSSSSRRARPVTYTISLTCPAIRAWVRPEFPEWIIAAHQAFDPGMPSSFIRVISHQLHHDCGSGLSVGGSTKNQQSLRFMRIVVELPLEGNGGLTAERKQELMRKIVESMQNYEGKKARETEIHVVIRKIWEEDELWIRGEI